eukprot:356884_1
MLALCFICMSFIHIFKFNGLVDANSPSLMWSITDTSLIHAILTAKNTHSFESPIFELNSFKWFIRISPNGRVEHEFGAFMLALVLASLPNDITNITCKPTFHLLEQNLSYPFTKIVDYQQGSSFRWGESILSTQSIQKLTTLTFHIYPNVITAYDTHQTPVPIPITQMIATISKTTMHFAYSWSLFDQLYKIKRAKPSHDSVWLSTAFGDDLFEWQLEFYPNGYPKRDGRVLLFIRFTCRNDDIGYVFIRYRLWLIEANVKFTYQREITNPMNSFGWYLDSLRNDEISHLKNITILCDLDVIEIYDKQHKIVTDYYAYLEQDVMDESKEYEVDIDKYGQITNKYDKQSEASVLIEEDVMDRIETSEWIDGDDTRMGMDLNECGNVLCPGEVETCNDDIGSTEYQSNTSYAANLLKVLLVMYCAGFHCAMFATFQTGTKSSVSVHCGLAFLYYICLFFADSVWKT